MAREESDREDLLREATALLERIELAPKNFAEADHIVIGFRAGGEASVFFGAEAAYHLNATNELRRAYANGLLIKADRGQLVSLERVRTENAVELRRHVLTTDEQSQFVAEMLQRVQYLREHIQQQQFTVIGQVPAEVDVLARVTLWLNEYREAKIAASPNVR